MPDSGGAGLNRGGLGVTKRYRARDSITFSLMSDRHKLAPWGLEGGGPAGKASCYIQREGHNDWVTAVEDAHKRSTSKFAGVTLNEGDRIQLTTGGGGGWGDPHKRDPEMVLDDVYDELVSLESAERDYGVVFTGNLEDDTLAVDHEATKKVRERKRPEPKASEDRKGGARL